jgi:hypothetical protein
MLVNKLNVLYNNKNDNENARFYHNTIVPIKPTFFFLKKKESI